MININYMICQIINNNKINDNNEMTLFLNKRLLKQDIKNILLQHICSDLVGIIIDYQNSIDGRFIHQFGNDVLESPLKIFVSEQELYVADFLKGNSIKC